MQAGILTTHIMKTEPKDEKHGSMGRICKQEQVQRILSLKKYDIFRWNALEITPSVGEAHPRGQHTGVGDGAGLKRSGIDGEGILV